MRKLAPFIALAALATTLVGGVANAERTTCGTAVPERLTEAWAANDARRVSDVFARTGDLVDTRGGHFAGRQAIRDRFEVAFDTFLKGTRPVLTVTGAKCVSDSVAVLQVTGGLVFSGESTPRPDTDQVQTWALQRRGNRWQVASLQATLNNPGGPDPTGPAAPATYSAAGRPGGSCKSSVDDIRAVPEQRMADAWQAADPVAFAGLFTRNGTLVVGDGTFLTGRQEITRYMKTVFEAVPGVHSTARAIAVECLDRSVGLVHTAGGLLLPGETEVPPERRGIQSWVLVRSGGEWLIAAYQNTRVAVT